ncbi:MULTISPECIES: SMI1/KNR4 family protein [Bacillaceae]|uniref:SMI1/KNR4 family protein n=1 Tax=Evansella alkalicola TaxID=745819 RepID=A0ABS6JRT1_9BACI|nr:MULTISPECIES: SMI1/KNR4 family protein [Bacillaceae]MBU9721286.1 SMI1/KNR4 family protein [Bacillus alkalicola]
MDFTIKNILRSLKRQLDNDNLIAVHDWSGLYPKKGIRLNSPVNPNELEKLMSKTGWSFPTDYIDFLSLHNGGKFFTYEFGSAFELYPIEELTNQYNLLNKSLSHIDFLQKEKWIPIGYVTDIGQVVLVYSHFSSKDRESVFIIDTDIVDCECDFKTWLDRMITVQGNLYWEWRSKVFHRKLR